ncbi:MAG: hypothetical protein FH758_11120 [Firmicutes bacterium]|nr:hypothetical protein [Bacillota bacterium]
MVLARENLDYNLPQESPPEQLSKVTEKSQRKNLGRAQARQKIKLTLMVLCCFAMGIIVAYYYAQIAIMGHKVDTLQNRLAELRLESHSLDQKVTQIASLKHIEAIATSELGMVKPGSRKVMLVATETKVPKNNSQLALGTENQQLSKREYIILPEEPEKESSPPNRLIQAFADMMDRWHS